MRFSGRLSEAFAYAVVLHAEAEDDDVPLRGWIESNLGKETLRP